MELPDFLKQGERSRLFPVLADTSKEGRTLSIFLACLENVDEFAQALFSSIGLRLGVRARIETYTEIVFKRSVEKHHRPDGLIVVNTGMRKWTALVEAKVGNTELSADQIESYLEIARADGVDAVVTLSNQFAPLPSHHPVEVASRLKKKVELYHWSWMYILTQANLLITNQDIKDHDQRTILRELNRFLTHQSAGVKSFDQMPAAWADLVQNVQAGGRITTTTKEVSEVAGAWNQECRDLSLILSRQLGIEVSNKLNRAQTADPGARIKATIDELVNRQCLSETLSVPDAAAPIEVCADLQKRTVSASMKVKAPADRKSTKARLNWLLRQIQEADPTDVHVRLHWPGRAAHTQFTLADLRADPDVASGDRPDLVVLSFEIMLVKALAGRFAQRRNFIGDLEAAVPYFYNSIGHRLKEWQPPAPKMREGKSEPSSVSPEALREEAEESAYESDK